MSHVPEIVFDPMYEIRVRLLRCCLLLIMGECAFCSVSYEYIRFGYLLLVKIPGMHFVILRVNSRWELFSTVLIPRSRSHLLYCFPFYF